MMQRKHPSEAMTGAPGALPGEAIRILTLIVAPQRVSGQRLRMYPINRRSRLRTSLPDGVLPGRRIVTTGRPVAAS